MSLACAWDIQKAVQNLLAASPAVTALLAAGAGGVHETVPEGAAFPYIALGQMQFRSLDTQGHSGSDVALDIAIFSRAPGLKEARTIQKAVHDVLEGANLTVPGFHVVLCRVTEMRSAIEGDGETRTASLRLRIVIENL